MTIPYVTPSLMSARDHPVFGCQYIETDEKYMFAKRQIEIVKLKEPSESVCVKFKSSLKNRDFHCVNFARLNRTFIDLVRVK